jgi:hypothetical protein
MELGNKLLSARSPSTTPVTAEPCGQGYTPVFAGEQEGEIPNQKGNAMSFRKAVLAGTAAAAAVVTVGAGTAMASPLPHHPAPAPRPESFTIAINGLTNTGTGVAKGPVYGAFTDKEPNGSNDIFTFARGSVDVSHTGGNNAMPTGFTPANSCTASIGFAGTWAMKGLTGDDRFAKGSGTYTATLTEVATENTTYKIEKVVKYVRVRVQERDRYGHKHFKFVVIREVREIKVPVQTCDATKPVSVTIDVTATGTAVNPRPIIVRPHGKV